MSATESPAAIVEALEGAGGDSRFRLRLGVSDAPSEIVFLDLRLHSGSSVAAEADVVSRLVGLARARFLHRAELPWPGFSDDELDRIAAWADHARHGDADRGGDVYLEALALLPRVLALTDFALPIILFSSTTQRAIAERLKPYGNIITGFEKPSLFGYVADDVVGRAHDSFTVVLKTALRLCRARKLCAALIRCAARDVPVQRRRLPDAHHFELYLDESGSTVLASDLNATEAERNRFVIGGILIGYRSMDGPGELHDRMAARGLRWWPETFGERYIVKRPPLDAVLDLPGAREMSRQDVMKQFLSCLRGESVAGVCLEDRGGVEGDDDEFRRASRGDNRYRLLVSALIELV